MKYIPVINWYTTNEKEFIINLSVSHIQPVRTWRAPFNLVIWGEKETYPRKFGIPGGIIKATLLTNERKVAFQKKYNHRTIGLGTVIYEIEKDDVTYGFIDTEHSYQLRG